MKNPTVEELFGTLTKKPTHLCKACNGLLNKTGNMAVCPRRGCRLQGQWINL